MKKLMCLLFALALMALVCPTDNAPACDESSSMTMGGYSSGGGMMHSAPMMMDDMYSYEVPQVRRRTTEQRMVAQPTRRKTTTRQVAVRMSRADFDVMGATPKFNDYHRIASQLEARPGIRFIVSVNQAPYVNRLVADECRRLEIVFTTAKPRTGRLTDSFPKGWTRGIYLCKSNSEGRLVLDRSMKLVSNDEGYKIVKVAGPVRRAIRQVTTRVLGPEFRQQTYSQPPVMTFRTPTRIVHQAPMVRTYSSNVMRGFSAGACVGSA